MHIIPIWDLSEAGFKLKLRKREDGYSDLLVQKKSEVGWKLRSSTRELLEESKHEKHYKALNDLDDLGPVVTNDMIPLDRHKSQLKADVDKRRNATKDLFTSGQL